MIEYQTGPFTAKGLYIGGTSPYFPIWGHVWSNFQWSGAGVGFLPSLLGPFLCREPLDLRWQRTSPARWRRQSAQPMLVDPNSHALGRSWRIEHQQKWPILGNEIEQTDSKCIRIRMNMWSGYEISTSIESTLESMMQAVYFPLSLIEDGLCFVHSRRHHLSQAHLFGHLGS